MAELTVLEDKLGEVIGLALAAPGATDKVGGLNEDEQLARQLEKMHEEARETENAAPASPRGWRAKRRPCSTRPARPRVRPQR